MKNTKLLIIILSILVLLLFFISILLSQKNNPPPAIPQPNVSITPTPFPTPAQTSNTPSIQIITTDPIDQQTTIPANKILTITFNKTVFPENLTFTIQPETPHTVTVTNNQLFIGFSSLLLPNNTYSYTINYPGITGKKTFTFSTADIESAKTHDNAAQSLYIWSKTQKPDLFVYNQIPHATPYFSITGDMTQTEPYHFYFITSLFGINKEQSKQEFINWLLSLELTNEQIQTLDIRYQ